MLLRAGLIRSLSPYLRTFCPGPRKSNPRAICVISVFSDASCRPRTARNSSTAGLTRCYSNSRLTPVTMKSSE